MENEYVQSANTQGTQRNHRTHKKRYLEFCEYSNTRPYPTNEFKIAKFATFLSNSMKKVQSIKTYCATICHENELRGFRPVHRGLKYYRAIDGIKQKLRHQVKHAQPMTVELLNKIERVVNIYIEKELVTWVTLLTGFHLVLPRSNLVPLHRAHDVVHNISCRDMRYGEGVMVIYIRWSKTNQHRERIHRTLMTANDKNEICPVCWIMYMINTIPARGFHNLLSYTNAKGEVVPITYRDLTIQMRKWLTLVGVKQVNRYSSHSLHRGGTTQMFKSGLSEKTIMTLGDWSSQCYKNYIEIDMDARAKA